MNILILVQHVQDKPNGHHYLVSILFISKTQNFTWKINENSKQKKTWQIPVGYKNQNFFYMWQHSEFLNIHADHNDISWVWGNTKHLTCSHAADNLCDLMQNFMKSPMVLGGISLLNVYIYTYTYMYTCIYMCVSQLKFLSQKLFLKLTHEHKS